MNARIETNIDLSDSDDGIVHHAFEQQAELTPNAIALSFQGEETSYSELNVRSNRLAHALVDCGLQSKQPVAIMLSDGPNQVVTLIAVLKAGGIIVCLDPAHPDARVSKIIEQSRPRIAITDAECQAKCSHLFAAADRSFSALLVVEGDAVNVLNPTVGDSAELSIDFCSLPTGNPRQRVDPTDPVYIVYTSGSSGTPKGICNHTGVSGSSFNGRVLSSASAHHSVSRNGRLYPTTPGTDRYSGRFVSARRFAWPHPRSATTHVHWQNG